MAVTFKDAFEVKEMAQEIIAAHHPHLLDERIEYVFRSDVPKKGGKEVWGTARKIGSLNAYLARLEGGDEEDGTDAPEGGEFFVLTISAPVWSVLKTTQQVALVDHELSHFWAEDVENEKTGETVRKRSIAPHDLEEFNAVVSRHGLWRPDISQFLKAADDHVQLKLDMDGPALFRESEDILTARDAVRSTLRAHNATVEISLPLPN